MIVGTTEVRKMGTKGNRPPRTDAGNAELFAARYKDTLRYDHRHKRWLIWRGHWWAEDTTGQVYVLALNAVRFRQRAATGLPADDPHRTEEIKWAVHSENRYGLEAMAKLAQWMPPLADDGANWDSDPLLLGVANGVVDLRTGTLRQGQPSDLITVHTKVAFDPSAQCPQWTRFLREIFNGDEQLIAFVQRALGYSLTGDTSEQCIFLAHGTGANGKSTLLEVLRCVLSDYAYNLPFSAFELNGRSSIPNDVAAIAGRRFVTAVETSETARWNEARMKALTGQDVITARFLYGEFFSFRPTAKFWLAFNHKPRAADDSEGFWRRIRLIPFTREFSSEEADKHLLEKLKTEALGILAWLVRGCLAWQHEGLGMPPAVKEATEAYREESDPLVQFMEERCVLDPQAHVTAADLWREYQNWCSESEETPLDRKKFAARLGARGFKKVRLGRERTWHWRGLRLSHEDALVSVCADGRTSADG